jgi:hypothetical protein
MRGIFIEVKVNPTEKLGGAAFGLSRKKMRQLFFSNIFTNYMKHAEHSGGGIFHFWNYASHFAFLEPFNVFLVQKKLLD